MPGKINPPKFTYLPPRFFPRKSYKLIRTAFTLFLLGLSFGAGPCMASCGPILISYVVGTKKGVLKSAGAYLLFSLARIFAYVALGVVVFFLGNFIAENWFSRFSRYILIAGGTFIIILGILTAFGRRLKSMPCLFLHEKFLKSDRKSLIFLGLILGVMPCAPLLALLGYVGMISKNWPSSIIYSFSFGLGTLLSPLLVITALAGLIRRFLQDRGETYQNIVSAISGVIIILLGIQLIYRAV
ncbi:MAG: sulfite exporter TauE/SafE family protein [Deltaproteobacteria bacterium]